MRTAVAGENLTRRELEVLREMARGSSNKLIGVALHLSDHTIKYHVANVCTKLGVSTRAGAVARYALMLVDGCAGCRDRLKELHQC